ncbi:hypothetical protein Dimus_036529, partial [Dionaea muscipula]
SLSEKSLSHSLNEETEQGLLICGMYYPTLFEAVCIETEMWGRLGRVALVYGNLCFPMVDDSYP